MNSDKLVLVTGGTGFVGHRLQGALVASGHTIEVVTRTPERHRSASSGVSYVPWLPELGREQAIVHLAGEPLFARRWNASVKAELRASRVDPTRRLVEAMRSAPTRPEVFVCASAVGYYGDRGDETLDESAAPGEGFLAEVCQAWEAEALRAEELGVRVVRLRIGVVLGSDGGALARMLTPFKLGLGGPIGSGAQWFSWIHRSDLCALIVRAVDDPAFSGAYNAVAPQSVTNRDFARALGRVLQRPAFLPTPAFALRLALGEVTDVLLESQRCVPRAAQAADFTFRFPELDAALADVLD
ncbi:MAG TPA: TIGR01777 family oxidoreductase [Planctomycetota bacterium]|nr:TIGR01777 family oxidoreductase [Planctomycetota bacterium]